MVDAALQLVLGLELAQLGRDQPQHHHLALRHEAQRLEIARALVVVFEEISGDVHAVEQGLGHRLVAALGNPGALEVAATEMHAHRHVLGARLDRIIYQLSVGRRQRRRILADVLDLLAQVWIAEIGEIDLVDLQIAAAGGGQVLDLLVVDPRQIGIEVAHVRIGLLVDRLAPAAEMHGRGRWDGDLGHRLRHRFQELEMLDEDRCRARQLAVDA